MGARAATLATSVLRLSISVWIWRTEVLMSVNGCQHFGSEKISAGQTISSRGVMTNVPRSGGESDRGEIADDRCRSDEVNGDVTLDSAGIRSRSTDPAAAKVVV